MGSSLIKSGKEPFWGKLGEGSRSLEQLSWSLTPPSRALDVQVNGLSSINSAIKVSLWEIGSRSLYTDA